jgi:hypothetical protein
MNGGPKSFCFRPLRVPGAPGARAGPGRVRGRRPWASGGGAVTGGSVTGGAGGAARCGGGAAGGWRLGRVAARSRSPVPVSGPGGPAFGGPWGGSGPRLRDSGGGFRGWICGAREDGGDTAALFTKAPAVAGDPVARRRRPRARRRPAPWAGAPGAVTRGGRCGPRGRVLLRLFLRRPGGCGRPRSSAPAGTLGGSAGAVTRGGRAARAAEC